MVSEFIVLGGVWRSRVAPIIVKGQEAEREEGTGDQTKPSEDKPRDILLLTRTTPKVSRSS